MTTKRTRTQAVPAWVPVEYRDGTGTNLGPGWTLAEVKRHLRRAATVEIAVPINAIAEEYLRRYGDTQEVTEHAIEALQPWMLEQWDRLTEQYPELLEWRRTRYEAWKAREPAQGKP